MSKPPRNDPPKPPAKRETKSAVTTTEIEAFFAGPLPTPALLAGYEQIVPGAAERLLAMAEAEAKHQREIEFAALRAEESSVRRGQWLGFGIALFALSTSIVALYLGSPWVAGIVGGATVVGLVSAFVIGRVGPSSGEGSANKE